MRSISDKRVRDFRGLRVKKRRFMVAGIFTALVVTSLLSLSVISAKSTSAGVPGVFTPGTGVKSSSIIAATPSAPLTVKSGERIALEARMVEKELNGTRLTMYGFNGQIPGPSLRVDQNSTIYVDFKNSIDLDTTVHWHGLRLANRFDGVPKITQAPIPPGGTFTYMLDFPDAGIYWYHPHVREDIQQDSGLYGTILVRPSDDDYYNLVQREEVLVVDDLLIRNGKIAPYGKSSANHAIMGRFGNVLLVNGTERYELTVEKGDVVRFYITNVANARPFNLSFGGAKTKLVGSDVGAYERESFVESIVITPAERYIVEVMFDEAREYTLQHITPDRTYSLGRIMVLPNQTAREGRSTEFHALKVNQTVRADIDNYRRYFDKPVDYQIDLSVELSDAIRPGGHGRHQRKIEWEDPIAEVNAGSTADDVRWILRDKATLKENMKIDYSFKVGDIVKLRLFSDPNAPHRMLHEIHFHGQRFLVIEQDGIKNDDLVWKDTVNVPAGSYVDILLDVTNPGEWMVHCHIAEHLEAGMMTSITVRG